MKNEKKYFPKSYPDLLDKIELSSYHIFKIINSFCLVFLQTRNQVVEWNIRFPMFVDSFYDYIINNKTLPTQQNFFDYYIYFNKMYFDENTFNSTIFEGLKARIFRTYPSLIRDLYFNKYVKENLPGVNVLYNIALDTAEGIDLIIENNHSFYAVNLYISTKHAYFARDKKRYRHTPFCNVKYIELPVNPKKCLKCGDFFLYGHSEFLSLKKKIRL